MEFTKEEFEAWQILVKQWNKHAGPGVTAKPVKYLTPKYSPGQTVYFVVPTTKNEVKIIPFLIGTILSDKDVIQYYEEIESDGWEYEIDLFATVEEAINYANESL